MCGRVFSTLRSQDLVNIARTNNRSSNATNGATRGFNNPPTSNLSVIVHKSCTIQTDSGYKSDDAPIEDGIVYRDDVEVEDLDVTMDEDVNHIYVEDEDGGSEKADVEGDVYLIKDSIKNRRLSVMRWGWFQCKVINCRGEELMEKPMFRPYLSSNRCVIIVEGIFEWNKEKQPFKYVSKKKNHMLIAGLYNNKAEVILLTVKANSHLGEVHHRMPVVMTDQEVDGWIDPKEPFNKQIDVLLDMEKEKWADVEAIRVSSLVSYLKNNTEDNVLSYDEYMNKQKEKKATICSFFTSKPKILESSNTEEAKKPEIGNWKIKGSHPSSSSSSKNKIFESKAAKKINAFEAGLPDPKHFKLK